MSSISDSHRREASLCEKHSFKVQHEENFSPELKCFNSHEHRLASIHVPGGKYCISYCHSLKFRLFWCEEVRTVYSRASRAIKFIKHNVCHVHHLRLTQTLTHQPAIQLSLIGLDVWTHHNSLRGRQMVYVHHRQYKKQIQIQ